MRIIGKNKIKEILNESQGCFYSLASLCVVSWYALNMCVENFVCSMFKAFLGNALNMRR